MFRTANDRERPAFKNHLLASLPTNEQATLRAALTRHDLPQGVSLETLSDAGGIVHFPETAVFCVRSRLPREKQLGLALIGREGALGWGGLAGLPSPDCHETVVISEGTTLAIETAALRRFCGSQPRLLERIVGFAFHLALQLASTVRANMSDPIDVRLCRWLLLWHDRLDDGELVLTHDLLAGMLAVRRATVTDALHILEGERLIACTRGRIVVRSRSLLEARAGIAYAEADRACFEQHERRERRVGCHDGSISAG